MKAPSPSEKKGQQNDAVLLTRATIIELLKTLEGLKRKLQLLLKA